MEGATDEEITHTYHKESQQISEVLASISHPKRPSNIIRSDTNTNELDLSELVVLRAAHKTEQARKGIRGSIGIHEGTLETPPDLSQEVELSRSRSARQEIERKFYQLLRDADAEGERVGTGLHRSYIWSGGNGNALNAAKAAESRTNAVCHSISFPLASIRCLNCSQGNEKMEVDLQRCSPNRAVGWRGTAR